MSFPEHSVEELLTPHLNQDSSAVHQSMSRGEPDDGTNGGYDLPKEPDDGEDALEPEGEEGHKLTADDTGAFEKGQLLFRRVHQQQTQSTPRVYNNRCNFQWSSHGRPFKFGRCLLEYYNSC